MATRCLAFFIMALTSWACTGRQAVAERWAGSDDNAELVNSSTATTGNSSSSYLRLLRLFGGNALPELLGNRPADDGGADKRREDIKAFTSSGDVTYRYLDLGKRNVDPHHFFVGLGRRSMDPKHFFVGLGKRSMDPHHFFVGLGRRSMDPKHFFVGLGKRSMDPKHFFVGLGRRSMDPKHFFVGLGKRSIDPRHLFVGLGKRTMDPKHFFVGLGKRSMDPNHLFVGLGKRNLDPHPFFVGLGKRIMDTRHLFVGLGKRNMDTRHLFVGLGKRNMDSRHLFVGLGKRNMDSRHLFVGLGKRGFVPASKKQSLDDSKTSFGISKQKRSLREFEQGVYSYPRLPVWRNTGIPASSFDEKFYVRRPILNGQVQQTEAKYFSDVEDASDLPDPVVDKRSMDTHRFNVGLGKRMKVVNLQQGGVSSFHAGISLNKKAVSFWRTGGHESRLKSRVSAPRTLTWRDKKRHLNPYYFKVGLGKRQVASGEMDRAEAAPSFARDELPALLYDTEDGDLDFEENPVFPTDEVTNSWPEDDAIEQTMDISSRSESDDRV